jgi:peptidoglycan/xylan/chitin deacetylase (PgdA/CDA1 family)
MPVLCLMYHHTPASEPETVWDVKLKDLKLGIEMLIDAGTNFIRLDEAHNPLHLSTGLHVLVTFDDGHATNAAAFEYLASRAIRPAAFIVKTWSLQRPEYLPREAIVDLASICDFGGHGTTHTALTRLTQRALDDELRDSKGYLQDALAAGVHAMSLPGGLGDSRVLRAAKAAGYTLVGTSVEQLTHRPSLTLNRVCIKGESKASVPLAYATAPSSYWMKRRLRHAASRLSVKLLGEGGHAHVTGQVKSLLNGLGAT